jgi:hypothetical protein
MPQPEDPISVPYQDRQVEAVRVAFTSGGEPFASYQLADGSTLQLKAVLLEVLRLVNEYNPNGDPVYVMKARPVSNVTVAPELRKPTS